MLRNINKISSFSSFSSRVFSSKPPNVVGIQSKHDLGKATGALWYYPVGVRSKDDLGKPILSPYTQSIAKKDFDILKDSENLYLCNFGNKALKDFGDEYFMNSMENASKLIRIQMDINQSKEDKSNLDRVKFQYHRIMKETTDEQLQNSKVRNLGPSLNGFISAGCTGTYVSTHEIDKVSPRTNYLVTALHCLDAAPSYDTVYKFQDIINTVGHELSDGLINWMTEKIRTKEPCGTDLRYSITSGIGASKDIYRPSDIIWCDERADVCVVKTKDWKSMYGMLKESYVNRENTDCDIFGWSYVNEVSPVTIADKIVVSPDKIKNLYGDVFGENKCLLGLSKEYFDPNNLETVFGQGTDAYNFHSQWTAPLKWSDEAESWLYALPTLNGFSGFAVCEWNTKNVIGINTGHSFRRKGQGNTCSPISQSMIDAINADYFQRS